jgi:hypothetical protein
VSPAAAPGNFLGELHDAIRLGSASTARSTTKDGTDAGASTWMLKVGGNWSLNGDTDDTVAVPASDDDFE